MANLRASALKSERWAMAEEVEELMGFPVVHRTTFLGVRMLDCQNKKNTVSTRPSMGRIAPLYEAEMHKIRTHAFVPQTKKILVHQWGYPSVLNLMEIYELPQAVLKTIKQYLRVGLGLNTRMSLYA